MHIEVIGHTDIMGSVEYNQQLSLRRAKAVQDWLVGKGISPDRLSFTGYGSTQPVASNETSLGRSQNRRVEIKVTRL
jgi:outer membrane protein OmpA-like peptidoglycan-associated protein